MDKSEQFLRHAEECRALARKALREDERKQLIEMAQTWVKLAETRAGMLANTRNASRT